MEQVRGERPSGQPPIGPGQQVCGTGAARARPTWDVGAALAVRWLPMRPAGCPGAPLVAHVPPSRAGPRTMAARLSASRSSTVVGSTAVSSRPKAPAPARAEKFQPGLQAQRHGEQPAAHVQRRRPTTLGAGSQLARGLDGPGPTCCCARCADDSLPHLFFKHHLCSTEENEHSSISCAADLLLQSQKAKVQWPTPPLCAPSLQRAKQSEGHAPLAGTAGRQGGACARRPAVQWRAGQLNSAYCEYCQQSAMLEAHAGRRSPAAAPVVLGSRDDTATSAASASGGVPPAEAATSASVVSWRISRHRLRPGSADKARTCWGGSKAGGEGCQPSQDWAAACCAKKVCTMYCHTWWENQTAASAQRPSKAGLLAPAVRYGQVCRACKPGAAWLPGLGLPTPASLGVRVQPFKLRVEHPLQRLAERRRTLLRKHAAGRWGWGGGLELPAIRAAHALPSRLARWQRPLRTRRGPLISGMAGAAYTASPASVECSAPVVGQLALAVGGQPGRVLLHQALDAGIGVACPGEFVCVFGVRWGGVGWGCAESV